MKNKSLGGCAQPLWIAATVWVAGAGLAGCGGGGGGSGGGMPLPLFPTTAAVPAPPPAPTSGRAINRDPVAGSEPAPLLSAPQPGSTAAVGNDSEGLYIDQHHATFVSASGLIAHKSFAGSLWGAIKVTGSNWSFNTGTAYFPDALPVTGSGTFAPRKTMTGSYAYGGREPSSFGPLNYMAENALAVSQDSVVGKWSSTDSPISFGVGVSIEVDAKGAFTGKTAGAQIGSCSISGTITQAQPGTAKNMYDFTLKAVDASTDGKGVCKLNTGGPYAGPAAVGLEPAGLFDSNGYFRSIMFLIKAPDGAIVTSGMRKQP